MPIVATLIAGTARPALDDTMIAEAARSLDATVDWLAPGIAVDLIADEGEAEKIEVTVRSALADRPVDVVVQSTANRRKKLLVADMDSTIITVECIDVLAARAGIGDEIAAITARTIRGELDFASSLRERVALLAGTPISALEEAWRQDVGLTPGARTLVATMAAHGAVTALISGGFTWFTERVADATGFAVYRANSLIVENGRLTGKVAEPVLDRNAKDAMLHDLARQKGIELADSLAVGDGANDIAMIRSAGLGVAFHGVDAVNRVADAMIVHGDLKALLYAQGYKIGEFVESPI